MGFWSRLSGTFLGQKTDSDVRQEIEFHIEKRAEDLIGEGHSKEEALGQARREFGNPSRWREETRDADVFVMLENWMRDTRQSLRGLRQRPVFAATAIGSLAIGIGAIASLFSIADAVIWKPVALPDEGNLYVLEEAKRGIPNGSNGPRLKDWQTLNSASAVTGFYGESLVWRGPGGNEAIRCVRTYAGFMATAQPPLAQGRGFTREEEAGEPVAMATYKFWRNRLNSGALDSIELSGKKYQVVGVLDASVGYPDGFDFWVPAPVGLQGGTRAAGYLEIIARLKPGVPASQAKSEIAVTAARFAQAYPKTDAQLTATLAPLRERISREARTSLFALLAVVACVLAMICVNVAALLLSRGTERERESALRSALGATPASLIRLYLIEAILLALAGGGLGVILALAAVDLLKQILPTSLPRLVDAAVDVRVLGFALLVSLVAALASGLTPAWLASRKTAFHDSARGAPARADRKQLRTVFVVVEIALSVVLVSTGFRLGQAFLELSNRPLGFRVDDVLAVTVPFPWTVKEDRLNAFATRAIERFGTLPGVTKAGLVDQYPLLGGTQDRDVRIQGIATAGAPIHAGLRLASPEYFDIMKVRLLEGRMFDTHKRIEFVANEAFAKRYFTDGRPASPQHVSFGTSNAFYDVVGVVSDVRQDAAKTSAAPELFTFYPNDYWPYLNFVLETTTPVSVLAPLIREEVAKLDGTVIVKSIAPIKDKLHDSTKDSRVQSILVGASATLALLLMAIGVHGLIAGDVATRWREFGVRLALGATIPSLRMLLVQKIAVLSAIGLAAGIAVVVMTSNLLASSFEGLPPVRVLTLAAVCLAIGAAALTAMVWPLYRIAHIDPSTALRHD